MATRKQLEQALQNPNVRKMLDLISYTEGTQGNGYRTAFGGGKLNSLKDHPRYSKSFTQTDGKSNKTSAAGRYQFLRGTWDSVARQYGLRDFSPKSQDLGAVALLFQRGAIPALLKGDYQTAIRKTGAEWASLPSSNYKQNKRSWDNVNKFLGGKIGNVSNNYEQPQQRFQLPQRRPLTELLAANKSPQAAFKPPERRPLSELLASNNKPEPFTLPERKPLSELLAGDSKPEPFVLPERKPLSELLGSKGVMQENTLVAEQPKAQPFSLPERQPLSELLAAQDPIDTNKTMPELEPQEWQL